MKHLYIITLFSIIAGIGLHAADPEQKLIDLVKRGGIGRDIESHVRKRLNTDVNNLFLGQSLLHCAANYGAVDVMEMLFNKGANINLRNTFGDIPLHYAAYNGHSEAVTFLLERGADTKALGHSNKTAAQMAKACRHLKVAKLIDNFNIQDIKEPEKE